MSELASTTTRLTEWEVRIHGAGALRVMGVPFGVTDSAARVLWWNQAMNVPAIEWLMANEETVRASATSPLRITGNTAQSITVDANGQSVITAGIAAFDVACAEVQAAVPLTVRLVNTVGVEMADYFVALGRARKIDTAVRTEATAVTFTVGGEVGGGRADIFLLEDALCRGVAVEAQAAIEFLNRGHQLWVPSSERSRAQGSSITDIPPDHQTEQR